METKINLLPFVVEALGNNKRIYRDIDKLYQSNKYEFYKAAKEHELYNHQIIKEGSLIQEEYCKKVLGIILGAVGNEKINKEIQNLIKKGFRYTWVYLEKHLKIDLKKFVDAFVKKYKGPVDEFEVPIEFHCVVLIFLTLNSQVELVQDDFYNGFLESLSLRWEHYNDTDKTRIGLDKVNDSDNEKIKIIRDSIYKNYGPIRNFNDILEGQYEEKNIDFTTFLFDYERLSSTSIFEDVKFANKDIDEILYLYIISNEKLQDKVDKALDYYEIVDLINDEMIESATKFLISHIYTKYLIKAYKQVKEMYFENNKETMFVELEGLERSLNSTTEKLFLAKQNLSALEKTHGLLEKENSRLRKELEQERRNREELNSLREFLFSLDKEEDFISEEFNSEDLKEYKAVVIGGHEKWQQRMKELLPNFVFIHPDNLNFDVRLLKDIDIVFIYTNYLNHGLYYKVMETIAGKDVKVAYINQQNEDKVLRTIYQKIKTLG